ncbi:MAG TPA: DUF1080 domain-containing protein, partial [Gemmataceae bacterium]|nr:DUF1080 domain-containing protein [Gemmataceae bacterium]
MSRWIPVVGLLAVLAVAVQADEVKKAEKAEKAKDGFVSIFNGKDLTGWKKHEGDKARWSVQNGAIVGEGDVGHLYTERGDYENFVFRVEAKISDKGNSGQYFRARFMQGFPRGYEAQINATHKDPIKTGSLYPFPMPRSEQAEFKKKCCVMNKPPAGAGPDEWFTQEVTADGNHIVIKVN